MNIPKLSVLEKGKLAGAEAAHHVAVTQRASWESFWGRPVETVLADLNADIPDILATFALNTSYNTSTNSVLDAFGDDERFSVRAPVTLPPGYAFEEGAWIYTPPPTPEPEP